MTVNVDLPDGRRVEFEDGVTQDVIERTTKSLLSAGDAKQPATSGTTMNTVGGLPLVSTGVAGIEEGGAPYSTGHVGEAAAEGYRAAPRLYSQEQLDDANKTIFGYAINNPLMQIANQVLPVGNALFRGGQQFVQEALSPISPALGRDVAAMPEAFIGGPHLGPLRPEPGLGTSLRNRMMPLDEPPPSAPVVRPSVGPTPIDRPSFISERTAPARTPGMTDAERIQQLVEHGVNEEQPPVGPPMARGPATREAAMGPSGPTEGGSPGFRPDVDPTKPFTYNPPSSGWPAGTERWAENQPQATGEAAAQAALEAQLRASRERQARDASGTEQPQGGAAGADITREPILPMTKTQAQDAFENSVLQTAEQRAGPQMVDHTPYITDKQGNPAQRTEAAREFSEQASAHEKALGDADPAFKQKVRETEDAGKDIALDNYMNQAGNNHAIDEAVKARRAFSPDELGVFDKETPTDKGQAIVDYFNRLLATRQGKRSNVRSVLEDARNGFLDKDGNPETLPNMLYGGRLNLTDILDEGLGSSTSTRKGSVQAARHFLTDALNDHVDPAINDGAPKFDLFRTKWAELSKPIDRMEFLQDHLFGPGDVRGADGKIQFGALQNLLEKMVKLRRSPGNNAAKSFDLEHLDPLLAIRNELAAWHLRDRLGKVAGSDTNQRAQAAATLKAGPLGRAISGAADVAGLALSMKAMGPLGAPFYATTGRPVVQGVIKRPGVKALNRVKERMLETTPRNELGPPGS